MLPSVGGPEEASVGRRRDGQEPAGLRSWAEHSGQKGRQEHSPRERRSLVCSEGRGGRCAGSLGEAQRGRRGRVGPSAKAWSWGFIQGTGGHGRALGRGLTCSGVRVQPPLLCGE